MFFPFERDGIGLHSGEWTRARIFPARSGSGIGFITEGIEIAASPISLAASPALATTLAGKGRSVTTVEHLLAALAATGESDVRVEVDGPEIPILDGSASPWYDALIAHGATPGFRFFEVASALEVRSKDCVARVTPIPDGGSPSIEVTLDFALLKGSCRTRTFRPKLDDFNDISRARTFVLEKDVETIRKNGLAKGGSLDNALVLGDRGPLNPDGMRFSDEPVRHKLVDVVGDLMILGALPFASVQLIKPGHHLLHELVHQLAPHAKPVSFLSFIKK